MVGIMHAGSTIVPSNGEFLPPKRLEEVRQHFWRKQSTHVFRNSALFQRLWNGQSPPERLEDISHLPLCTKAMLRDSQAKHPPFGDFLAVAPDQVVRLHRSSGTTGRSMNFGLTVLDSEVMAQVGARSHLAAGLKPGDMVVHCLNYQMWMGGFTDHLCLEAAGATVIPFGTGNTELLVRTLLDLDVAAIQCTPSYPAVIEQTIAEKFPATKPSDLGLRLGLFGGEAALDNQSFRDRLEAVWGFRVRNANYGMSDVFCNFASQCDATTDLHFLGQDVLYPEIIDPVSEQALPWREGEKGELVLTNLIRNAQPLVRYRTGDVALITGTGVCECGRTATRFRILGRSDDMVVIRGVNVFPSAVAGVLNQFRELSGEFRVRLKGPGPFNRLPVEVELADGYKTSPELEESIEKALKANLRASAAVTLFASRSMPRTEGKTKRLIRED